MGRHESLPDIIRLVRSAPNAAERTAIEFALSRLRLSAQLIDAAGRGLAPFVASASAEALLELSVELGRIETLMSKTALSVGRP
ncbi:MAG: hypothetical protein IAE87_04105 [Rhodobacteraceae bacterium]|jgi:hypothetical protein|nr:hypothetical protein [Paracoccaceae bacterium]